MIQEAGVAPVGAGHWSDAIWRWRDQLLASPRFQSHAQRFAPTRWFARRRAAALFDLMAGFVYSQVLLACVRLKCFDLLARSGPMTAAHFAAATGLPPASSERLLLAAVSLRLLEHRPCGRFGLGPLGLPMVGNAGLSALVEHQEHLYRDLLDPLALLRGAAPGQLAGFWPYAGTNTPSSLAGPGVTPYSEVMALSQPWVAEQILQAYPLARHRRLLDVGGGEGVFACAAASFAPQLHVQVFDLPAVADRARARFECKGLAGRAEAIGGDFFNHELPRGADLISLVRVVHDHDDARVLRLFAAIRRALAPGGTILLAEPMAGTAGAEAMGAAYFGFYLLAMGRGQPRRFERLREMLLGSGFEDVRLHKTTMPLQTRVLTARALP